MVINISDLQARTEGCPEVWAALLACSNITGDGGNLQVPAEALAKAAETCPGMVGIRGLGDVVHGILHPIARGVDAVLGTDLQNCGGCAERRHVLNEIAPLK